MKITNDAQLAQTIQQADKLIQSIHDYAGRDFTKRWKLRFPRGYLRTAEEQRNRLPFLGKGALKDNIAYTLILSDTTHWLLARTDISGTAKEQMIKLHLFLLGALVESITKIFLKGRCGKNYGERNEYLFKNQIIDQDLKDDLNWLWDMRNNMHLFLVADSEYNCPEYTVPNYNRAVRAFQALLSRLK